MLQHISTRPRRSARPKPAFGSLVTPSPAATVIAMGCSSSNEEAKRTLARVAAVMVLDEVRKAARS